MQVNVGEEEAVMLTELTFHTATEVLMAEVEQNPSLTVRLITVLLAGVKTVEAILLPVDHRYVKPTAAAVVAMRAPGAPVTALALSVML